MWLSKVKTAMAVVLTMSVVGLSGGAISYSLWAGEEEGPKGQQEKSSPAVKQADDGANNKNAAQTDKDKLQGVWKLVRLEALGHVFGADKLSEIGNLAVNGDWIYTPNREAPEFRYLQFHYWVEDIERVCTLAVRRWQGTYELDSSTNPKRITITDCANYQRHDWMGIYALDEDELRLCLSEKGWVREIPSEFKAKEGSSFIFFTFKREKPSDAQKKKEPFERFYTGGFQSIQGFEFRGVDKTDEKRFRQYEVKCTLVGVGPSGTDFGADGTGKILADPVLIIPEGKERRILSGGQQAVPGDKDNAVEFLDLGVSVRVKVIGLTDDRVRLETALERTEVNSADQKGVLVRGKSVRSIARVKLGETVKLVEKDDRGEARYWVRVKVVKVENVVSRTAPGKADGNKRPSFQEIARRLGLSDIQTFLFAEAVQGYTDAVPISDVARDFGMKEIDVFLLTEALRRDAVADGSKRPTFQEVARRLGVSETNLYIIAEALQGGRPLSDVARNFGMKEIDVFLLQEALQRDIADKRDAADKAGNQEGRHKKGNQSGLNYRLPNGSPVALDFGFPINKGPADNKQPFKASGDFIFLNSLEYQIPISRNDQQQFSFWVGFFGH